MTPQIDQNNTYAITGSMTTETQEPDYPTFFASGPETPGEKRARRKNQAEYVAGLPEVDFEDTSARFKRLFGHAISGVSDEEMKRLMADYDASHPADAEKEPA